MGRPTKNGARDMREVRVSYNSYIKGKKNRDFVPLKLDSELREFLIAVSYDIRFNEKKEENFFRKLGDRLQKGHNTITARQFDRLHGILAESYQEKLEQALKEGDKLNVFNELGSEE